MPGFLEKETEVQDNAHLREPGSGQEGTGAPRLSPLHQCPRGHEARTPVNARVAPRGPLPPAPLLPGSADAPWQPRRFVQGGASSPAPPSGSGHNKQPGSRAQQPAREAGQALADQCVRSGSRSERECQELALWPGRPQGTCDARRPPDLGTGAVSPDSRTAGEGRAAGGTGPWGRGAGWPGSGSGAGQHHLPFPSRAQGRWGAGGTGCGAWPCSGEASVSPGGGRSRDEDPGCGAH